jgi:hypothetical protein
MQGIRIILAVMLLPICYAEPWSFALVSDSYGGLEWSLKTSMENAHEEDDSIKFIIASGDIVAGEIVDSYFDDSLLKYYPGQRHVPWIQSVGNHNTDQTDYMDYLEKTLGPRIQQIPGIENFRQGPYDNKKTLARKYTTFSFDYKNAHFVFYNQYYEDDRWDDMGCLYDEVTSWVEEDLQETKQPIKFVIGHEPAFPCQPEENRHCSDSLDNIRCPDNEPNGVSPNRPARDQFWQMLNDNQVTAHIVGHTHQYCARVVKSLDDFPGIDCKNGKCSCESWNCYCDNEQRLAQIKTGEELTSKDGVIELDTGITGSWGHYTVINIDGNTVEFSSYQYNRDKVTFPLIRQFTYQAAAECNSDNDCETLECKEASCVNGACEYTDLDCPKPVEPKIVTKYALREVLESLILWKNGLASRDNLDRTVSGWLTAYSS